MFSFLGNLPDVVVRKIYTCSDTKTKWMLNKAYADTEIVNPLQRSGCLDHKELLFCFICQNNIYYKNFCHEPVLSRRINDDILKQFETDLNNVYQTRNLDDLYQHLVTEHGPHDYLPQLYWDALDAKIRSDYEFATNPHPLEAEMRERMAELRYGYDPFSKHKMSLARKKVHKALAKILVRVVFKQLSLCHAIGNSWEPLFLSYNGAEPELVPEYKAIRSFNLFLYSVEQQHMVQYQTSQYDIGGYYAQFPSIGKQLKP